MLSPLAALALDPTRTVYQYATQNWSRRNGLPVTGVKSITQTKDGYIWLGTQKGLVRFDGVSFASFPIPEHPMFVSQNVSRVVAAPDGGVWFGLRESAAGHFDGKRFAPLTAEWVDPLMEVFDLCVARDGALWIGSNRGFGRWIEGRAVTPPEDFRVGVVPFHAVYEDSKGRVWLGAADHDRLYYWHSGAIHSLAEDDLKHLYIYSFAEDHDGNIWMGTNLGLRCYGPDLKRKQLPFVEVWGEVNKIFVDRHGVVWIGTMETGVHRFKNGKFTRFGKEHGLVDENVLAFYEDHEGSLWIGTQGGLTQLSDIKFPIYSVTEGLPAEPLSVAASAQGTLWVGTGKGLVHLDGDRIKTYGAEAGITNLWTRRIHEARNGDVYVLGGEKDVAIISEGRVVARHATSTWPLGIAEDDQSVVISVAHELFRVDRSGITPMNFVFEHDGSPARLGYVINLSAGRSGQIWAATHEGVWRLHQGVARQWSDYNGLGSTVAPWVFEDSDGAVWAGLSSGLARIKEDEVRNIGRADGLFTNYIIAIVPDDHGWFWIDSKQGLFRVRRDELNAFADGKIPRIECEPFTAQHALKGNDKGKQEGTAVRSRDGRIWFPAVQGLIAVDPARVPVNQVPPKILIERLTANGQEYAGPSVPRIPAGRGELELHYTALSFVAPEELRFRYQLQGYEDRWIEAGARRSAYFTNLPPGRYVFRVQGRNADGVWSAEGASLTLELAPHFYETGWFVVVGVAGFLACLGGAYAWRTSALRRRERLLKAMNDKLEEGVRERTAELERANVLLREQIAERERIEHAAEEANRQLLLASRQAGMAEVATSVLHNVGNVLNSVNVSALLLAEQLRKSRVGNLPKLARLLAENADRADFLRSDEKGRRVPAYVDQLAVELDDERARMREEVEALRKNVEHIKEIVQMQQSFSRMSGVTEQVSVDSIWEDTLRLNGASLLRNEVAIDRQIEPGLELVVEKHKVLQIVVNLVRNAVLACRDAGRADAKIAFRAQRCEGDTVRLEVSDNGVGIPPENLTKIFTQGFTTRKNGHGYGLHSSANAAKAMGGSLYAHSDGPGLGATFILELPIRPRRAADSRAPFDSAQVDARSSDNVLAR